MGWRFRKSFGNKFLRLNISKSGFSVTSGIPGFHVNTDLSNRRKRMFRNTFGLPGSGLSYQTKDYGPERLPVGREGNTGGLIFVAGVILIFLLWVSGFGGV